MSPKSVQWGWHRQGDEQGPDKCGREAEGSIKRKVDGGEGVVRKRAFFASHRISTEPEPS